MGIASREICKICFSINPIGFVVPDEIWDEVIPPVYGKNIVCISCFTRLADEKLISWDTNIQLFPVSLYSCIEDERIWELKRNMWTEWIKSL